MASLRRSSSTRAASRAQLTPGHGELPVGGAPQRSVVSEPEAVEQERHGQEHEHESGTVRQYVGCPVGSNSARPVQHTAPDDAGQHHQHAGQQGRATDEETRQHERQEEDEVRSAARPAPFTPSMPPARPDR